MGPADRDSAASSADACVRVGACEPRRLSPGQRLGGPPESYLLRDGELTLLVTGGTVITVDAKPGGDPSATSLQVCGPGLGVLLSQRERLVLHGCSVQGPSGTTVFLGASGAGKSTLAAALHLRGHRILADDMSVLAQGGACASILPGTRRIKLWPDAAEALGLAWRDLPRIRAAHEKRVLELADGAPLSASCLARVFVLADGDRFTLSPLDAGTALWQLTTHTYALRAWARQALGAHLRQCSEIIAQVQVAMLQRPRGLERIDELAAFVEEHALQR